MLVEGESKLYGIEKGRREGWFLDVARYDTVQSVVPAHGHTPTCSPSLPILLSTSPSLTPSSSLRFALFLFLCLHLHIHIHLERAPARSSPNLRPSPGSSSSSSQPRPWGCQTQAESSSARDSLEMKRVPPRGVSYPLSYVR